MKIGIFKLGMPAFSVREEGRILGVTIPPTPLCHMPHKAAYLGDWGPFHAMYGPPISVLTATLRSTMLP